MVKKSFKEVFKNVFIYLIVFPVVFIGSIFLIAVALSLGAR